MTTGKTIALNQQTFVGKVMSLLLNMLSRLVVTFLPRSKHLLISWLQSPFAVILEPPKIKSDTVSTVSPSISHEVMGPDATSLFLCSTKVCNLLALKEISLKITFTFQFSHSVMSDSLWPHGLQHSHLPYPSNSQSLIKLICIESVRSSNHLILCHPSPPAFNISQHQGFSQRVISLHQVDKLLELKPQHQSFQWIFRLDFL